MIESPHNFASKVPFNDQEGCNPKLGFSLKQGGDMLYLIVSLVAGLYFLISGKVKFGKTSYLEGIKARIAGLLFLAPLGLTLVGLIILYVLEAFGLFNFTESFNQAFDAFVSALVRNGFMIGLAYISFNSVSRDTKERGGCLTYWLAYSAIVALLGVYFGSSFISNTSWFLNGTIGITIFQIIFIIGIWLWNKWGIFGYAAITLMTPIIAYIRVESISEAFISLIQALSIILVLYLLVKPKWQLFEQKGD
jgi:hypothetical protein